MVIRVAGAGGGAAGPTEHHLPGTGSGQGAARGVQRGAAGVALLQGGAGQAQDHRAVRPAQQRRVTQLWLATSILGQSDMPIS